MMVSYDKKQIPARSGKMKPNASFIIFLVIILVSFMILGLFFAHTQYQEAHAIRGEISLTPSDLSTNNAIALNGDWAFYWNQFLTPIDFAGLTSMQPEMLYLQVPSPWFTTSSASAPEKFGAGTYRLVLHVPKGDTFYGLYITNVRMSCRLFVNGHLMQQQGQPSIEESTAISRNVPFTEYFMAESEVVEILLQVSNYEYKSGGILQPIYFGTKETIELLRLRAITYDLISAIMLFMTAMYFGASFVFNRKDTSTVFFSIYCLCFSFFVLMSNEKLLMLFGERLDFIFLIRLKYLLIIGGFFASMWFVHVIGQHLFPKKVLIFYMILFSLWTCVIILLEFPFISKLDDWILMSCFTSNLMIVFFLFKALIKKTYGQLDSSGIVLLSISSVLIACNSIINLLINYGTVEWRNVSNLILFIYVLVTTLFISKRHAMAYHKVTQLNDQLQKMDHFKDAFLLNTSHELKSPLLGIINILQVSIERDRAQMTRQQMEDIQFVIANSKRLSSLINDIIDFQSIKNNVLRINPHCFDINAPIRLVVDVFQRIYSDKPVSINNEVHSGVHIVMADEHRVLQILYNLLGNAMQHTDKGTVMLYASNTKDKVTIHIVDTGTGFAEDRRQHIFYDFTSAPRRKEDLQPSGLGLPISKALADKMGGQLWFQTSTNQTGSHFCFSLPLCSKEQYMSQDHQSFEELSLSMNLPNLIHDASSIQEMPTILIVDDEMSNIMTMKRIFPEDHYHIITAYSGQAALELVKQQKNLSIILLDVMMPDISGFEVCRQIRLRYPLFELPILLMTVIESPDDIAFGLAAGANDFLLKPYDAKVLKARVMTLINMCEAIKQASDAEIAFLQAQVKPHFLYNALNSIAALCRKQPKEAEALTLDLAAYLRASFDFQNLETLVTVKRELELVKHYLSIEKVRFGNRLQIVYDVNEQIDILIPPLILQPLVENAVKHGIAPKTAGGTVFISIRQEKSGWFFQIEDDGVGMQASTKQILTSSDKHRPVGLENIRKRLLTMYGSVLVIDPRNGGGTTVCFTIPSEKEHEEAEK
jgi:two-component system, sensor histidine kinase ChiS